MHLSKAECSISEDFEDMSGSTDLPLAILLWSYKVKQNSTDKLNIGEENNIEYTISSVKNRLTTKNNGFMLIFMI